MREGARNGIESERAGGIGLLSGVRRRRRMTITWRCSIESRLPGSQRSQKTFDGVMCRFLWFLSRNKKDDGERRDRAEHPFKQTYQHITHRRRKSRGWSECLGEGKFNKQSTLRVFFCFSTAKLWTFHVPLASFYHAKKQTKTQHPSRSQRRVNSEMAQSKCTGNVTPFGAHGVRERKNDLAIKILMFDISPSEHKGGEGEIFNFRKATSERAAAKVGRRSWHDEFLASH